MADLKLGMIGLDTSHAKVFTNLLNDPNHEHHVPGAKVVFAYPGGSPDFKASISRVEGYTNELREKLGVTIMETPEQVAEQSDALMLTAVDGRVHPELFSRIASFGKPVFIDKPLAVSYAEAMSIAETADRHGIPWMSGSVRRFARGLEEALNREDGAAITGSDSYGPIEFVASQPGYFWYGIHLVDVLYRTMGPGCKSVTAFSSGEYETVTAVWGDGRIGTLRGNRGNITHGTFLHRGKTTEYVDTMIDGQYKYANLLRSVLNMFATGKPGIETKETLEIMRFMEAVNESRESGRTVQL